MVAKGGMPSFDVGIGNVVADFKLDFHYAAIDQFGYQASPKASNVGVAVAAPAYALQCTMLRNQVFRLVPE